MKYPKEIYLDGYTQVEKVKQLQILTTALSAEESYERSRLCYGICNRI